LEWILKIEHQSMHKSMKIELLSDSIDLSNSYKREIAEILKNIPIINVNQTPFEVSQIRKIASQSPQLIFITAELINYEQIQSCKGLIRRIRKKSHKQELFFLATSLPKLTNS
jgi:hypothetical protein